MNRTKLMVTTAVFTAMITVGIMIFRIPVGPAGIIHFGDAIIYLAACALPMPYAIAAASIGGGLADLLVGLPVWAPFTVIIKPLIVICFKKHGNLMCIQNAIAMLVATVITAVGYYIAQAVIYGNWVAPMTSIPGNLIQSGGSAVIFIIIAAAFDRMGIRSRLNLNM